MAGKKTGKRLLTWVLVLVMALSLLPLNVLAAENGVPENTNPSIVKSEETRDAHLVKSATKEGDTYQIQLESWVTGKVEQTTGSAPLDIVLVLDQSGSMEGKKLSKLKEAVRNFVATINQNAKDNNVEHRIAIVGFASNGDDGWDNDDKWENTGLFVNGEFKKYITYTSSGYYAVYALNQANSYYIMQPGLFGNYAVKVSYNSQKDSWGYWEDYLFYKKWVAVTPMESEDDANNSHTQFYEWREGGSQGLTDQDYHDALVSSDDSSITTAIGNLSASGATRASYGMEMANNVFENNALRKGSSRVVVFFTDGEPGYSGYETDEAGRAIAQAHATKNNPYNAKVFSVGMFDDPSDEVKNFMNYVSSNYPNANASEPSYSGEDWTITSGDPDADKYYMTVKDGDLSTVFEKISGSILTSDVTAGKDTVLTDTLSQYFDFDGVTVENGTVTGVTVKKVAYQGNDKWAENGQDITSSVDVGLNGKTVTVSGFDYSAEENVVTDGTNPSGYKLVVTFKVKPDTNCTNWDVSGRYPTNSGKATLAKDDEEPFATVDSPNAYVETYQVTYGFDTTAPDGATHPEDNQYYISGQTADVKPPEPSSIELDGHTYTFNGWKNGDTPVSDTVRINNADVKLTGTWTMTPNTATYTVKYLWDNKPIPGTEPTTGSKNCGETVTVKPITIEGYTPVSSAEKTIKIDADNSKNVIIFYYYKNVTLTANSKAKPYDGKEHSVDGFTATDAFNEPVTARFGNTWPSVKGTDAGEYPVTFAEDTENKVSDDHLYIVTAVNPGKLTINKRSVTLTSASASKAYDGTPLTRPTVTVGGDGFVEGEVTGIKATGSVTNVNEGEVTNTIEYTTTDKFKANNYNITKHEGTLKITEASAPTPGTFDFNDVFHDGKNTPAITKTVKGNVGRNFKETFAVTVKGADRESAATMSAPSYTGEAKVTYSDLTNIAFRFAGNDKLTFRDGGKYTYTVRELPGQTSRMSYDTTEYTLTITVALDKEANAYKVTSWQFTAGNREYPAPLNIVNTYRTYHPSTPSKPTLNTGDHYAYVMGYPDGTVRPNGSITRAEVSAILFRLLSDKTRDEYFTTESSFTDVKAGAWYNNSIATLEKAGVIVDTAKGGAFRPNEAITRAELAAMLAQFSDAKPVKGVKFSDVSAGHWAYEAIAIAAKMGWIEGYPDGTFRPDATITRAEMMTLVNRALERVPSDEDHLLSKRVMLTFPDCKSGDWFYIAVQEATNSHTYERAATEKNGDEQWTALRANRDWTLLEK